MLTLFHFKKQILDHYDVNRKFKEIYVQKYFRF